MRAEMAERLYGVSVRKFLIRETIMKRLKRILAVLTLIVAALVISYLVYTGGQVNA